MARKLIAVESLIIDGEADESNQMQGCDDGEAGFHPPFALFSADLQMNVGGPYAKRSHAEEALKVMKAGGMVPYTTNAEVIWTVNGQPSVWYDKDEE
jgi:hypothetical protein